MTTNRFDSIPRSTLIPASALLFQILNQRPDSMRHGITLTPTLSVGVDIMGIGVVLVSFMGLLGVAKGCRRLMNMYFGIVLCFIAVQVGYAVMGFMSGADWVHEALEKSWDRAYQTDRSLIHDLQIELTGVFLLSVLFKHLATVDQEDPDNEDGNFKVDEESPYFQSEKQLEYENSRIPLLSGEDDEDLPHYSAHNCNDSEDSEDDDEDCGDEKRFLGSSRYECDYGNLPEYAEDDCEPHVYVA
ncbi:hypothetical protein BGZ95_007471 [Linnemannia exigua]|uniref:Uncharacterized protein n=1 Tax=Linnemannia exigua TaxID=604196 RepID=A0AAD4DFF3_9FUNG|nr:hypothetical protein BGZ95_007471 [Linnemannia exigua]